MARHSAKHAKRSSASFSFPPVNWTFLSIAVGVGVLLLVGGVYGAQGGFGRHAPAAAGGGPQRVSSRLTTPAVDSTATPVEVPALVGLGIDEATLVLKAAGLASLVRREGQVRSAEPTITSQEPAPGVLARGGTVVTLVLPAGASSSQTAKKAKTAVKRGSYVVCIDPGHQSHTDSKTEAMGPGSPVRKPRITGGTTGVFTQAPEYETALQIATNLKRRLEAAGVTVIMTRTTNDVNLSNAERAQMASAAGADLFVRLHADSSTDGNLSGVSTLFPTSSAWTLPIAERSRRAATLVQSTLVKETRAVDRGVAERADLAGFNFSTVPAVLVAVGYPSNRVEDRLLVSPNYQDRVAQGLTDGILSYLKGQH